MAVFNPYLHFTGNTEEAFNFYKSVFGGEFTRVTRFKELATGGEHEIPEEFNEKIMFITLPIGKHNVLMGSDALKEGDGREFTISDNFHISISAETREEADSLFNALSAGGSIEMPFGESPWGSFFGMLRDKFGVQWTVEYSPNVE